MNLISVLETWIESCTRAGKISRNTIAVGIVVLDQLRRGIPKDERELLSPGGELVGARSALGQTLEKYDLPRGFLKEVTTRQAAHDGLNLLWRLKKETRLATMPPEKREEVLLGMIGVLVAHARKWLARQNLRASCDRGDHPGAWVKSLLEKAKDRSGGRVEQHLVGAKLQTRFPDRHIENMPGHAGDVQTGRPGDFVLGSSVYHVTAAPSRALIQKCAENLSQNLRPIMIVPRDSAAKAIHLAEEDGLQDRILVLPIEEFIATNVVELARGVDSEFLPAFKAIIDEYNRRLDEVETDKSLKIDVM